LQRSRNPGERGRGSRAPDAARSTIRCFVALQPDDAARDRLDALAREQQARFSPARRMQRENLHLTLAFIGQLPREQAQQVATQLAQLPAPGFTWLLDSVGAFARSRVLWAGGTSEELAGLAERSRRLLEALAVPFDHRPFVAHATLLRKLPREAARLVGGPIEPPIPWHAAAPVLLQSTTDEHGTRYVVLPALSSG
jgi:2'-5' RNA ligase